MLQIMRVSRVIIDTDGEVIGARAFWNRDVGAKTGGRWR